MNYNSNSNNGFSNNLGILVHQNFKNFGQKRFLYIIRGAGPQCGGRSFSNDMIVTLHLELHTNVGAVGKHSMDFFLLKLYTLYYLLRQTNFQ